MVTWGWPQRSVRLPSPKMDPESCFTHWKQQNVGVSSKNLRFHCLAPAETTDKFIQDVMDHVFSVPTFLIIFLGGSRRGINLQHCNTVMSNLGAVCSHLKRFRICQRHDRHHATWVQRGPRVEMMKMIVHFRFGMVIVPLCHYVPF